MGDCTFFLLSLPPDVPARVLLKQLGISPPLVAGIPHGWVLRPHSKNAQDLIGRDWNLFILVASSSNNEVELAAKNSRAAFLCGSVSISGPEYDRLNDNIRKPATPSSDTPLLPREWSDATTGMIPDKHVVPPKDASLEPGELKLHEPLATFLSTALPGAVRDRPVSLFNLFKYRSGDPSVHEHYMQGFKETFGPAAGAQLKFMGAVSSQPQLVGANAEKERGAGDAGWQDANIVHYDSIWHYAYMLSTDVYQELNKEKVEGLEDTCILLISEVELES